MGTKMASGADVASDEVIVVMLFFGVVKSLSWKHSEVIVFVSLIDQ
jgi:hypothetical protein